MGRTDMKTNRSILQFRYDHQLSMAEIARAVRVSQGTVHNILSRARGAGLDRWPLPEGLDDAALRRALYPPVPVPEPDDRLEPDWSDAVKELTRKRKPREPKPTRLVLWERYCDAAREAGMPAYSYSRYCERLAPQLPGSRSQASMRFTYAPGECLFTDFAGRTLRLADGTAVEIFVGILAWSRYTYAEAVPSQKAEHWCMAHSRMFTALGGVTTRLIFDNLKSAVTYNDGRGEVVLAEAFDSLCKHYNVAGLPTGKAAPKQKAAVEKAVQVVTTRVLAPLSDRTFLTLAEMNDAVAAKCRALNDAPMIREAVSRSQLFAEERPMLRPLPAQAWQWVTWTSRVVASDCHIQLETCFYSVPHFWCEQRVRVRLGAKTVEIFPPKPVQRGDDPDPIAVHPRLFGRNRHATVAAHLPPAHRAVQETLRPDAPARLEGQLRANGTATSAWVDREIRRRSHRLQAYRTLRGAARLIQDHGPDPVEAACARALETGRIGSGFLSAWLKTRAGTATPTAETIPPHPHIRGSGYWTPSPDTKEIPDDPAQPRP